jgi:hypothetical protein
MKPWSGDKQLGLALPLERSAGQSDETNHPSTNEVGLDVSHHTHYRDFSPTIRLTSQQISSLH